MKDISIHISLASIFLYFGGQFRNLYSLTVTDTTDSLLSREREREVPFALDSPIQFVFASSKPRPCQHQSKK